MPMSKGGKRRPVAFAWEGLGDTTRGFHGVNCGAKEHYNVTRTTRTTRELMGVN